MEYSQKGKDNSVTLNFGMIQFCHGHPSSHSEDVGVCNGAVYDLFAIRSLPAQLGEDLFFCFKSKVIFESWMDTKFNFY